VGRPGEAAAGAILVEFDVLIARAGGAGASAIAGGEPAAEGVDTAGEAMTVAIDQAEDLSGGRTVDRGGTLQCVVECDTQNPTAT
jgi:hypothetical protein